MPGMIRFKVAWAGGNQVVTFEAKPSWAEFQTKMSSLSSIPIENLVVKAGYPQRDVLEINHLQSGELVRLEFGSPVRPCIYQR